MDVADNKTTVAAYNPATDSWRFVTVAQFIRTLQPFGWLIGTQRQMRNGETPAPPEPRPEDGSTTDPENDGQTARKKVYAHDLRTGASGAVETLGNWRINGGGQRVTGYVRGKGNTGTLRVHYRTHGTGDRDLLLVLPDVEDIDGNKWKIDVIFPATAGAAFADVDLTGLPIPDQPSVKISFRQSGSNNGNVTIETIEVL